MSLFDKLFGNVPKAKGQYDGFFELLNGYKPVFTSWNGGVYESALVRAAINARSTHVAKLNVEILGSARPALRNKMRHAPNEFSTWGQFLYRLNTILDIHNTAFIVPVYDEYGEPTGIYPIIPRKCEFVEYGGKPYLRYAFSDGSKAAIELEYCGIMTKYQYADDLLGEDNKALFPTMELIHMQNQAIKEGIESAATYSFIAQLTNFGFAEDIAKERKRFTRENLSRDAKARGLLLFPNTYSNIKQIESKPFVIDPEQTKMIRENVYEYYGVNEDVLQNRAFGDSWSAFYEGAIESFAIQFSDVATKMLFTLREQSNGNRVVATSNRLQYMSNADKLAVTSAWADRGTATIDEIREVWNKPPLPNGMGNVIPIRGEYYDLRTGDRLQAGGTGDE